MSFETFTTIVYIILWMIYIVQIVLPIIVWTAVTTIFSLIIPLIIVSHLSATSNRFQAHIQKREDAAETAFSLTSFVCVIASTIFWKVIIPNDSSLHLGHFQALIVGTFSWVAVVYIVFIFEETISASEKKYEEYSY